MILPLGRPETERKRNFFPYLFQERDNNLNIPPDPTFKIFFLILIKGYRNFVNFCEIKK